MNLVSNLYYFIRSTGNNIIPIERSVIDFYHIMIVLKGRFTFVINGEELILEENHALLLPPGTDRQRLPHPGNADFAVFNFRFTKDNETSSYLLFKNAVTPYIRRLLDSYPYKYYNDISHKYKFYIDRNNQIDNSRELAKIKGILHNHLNCILIDLFDSLKYTTNNHHIINTLKYINDNITNPLTLSDVCRAIHLSKEYTARIFKKEMNMTVTEYITQQKLSLAKLMLESDEMALQDISEKLGYQNYNYFSRMFKKYYEISPLKMKSKLKNR